MANPLGSTPGIIVGVGVGGAAAAALEPGFELLKQDAWTRNAHRVLDVGLLARLVATGGLSFATAEAVAARSGYAADELDRLTYLSQVVPPVAEALTLWRRGLIDDTLYERALTKHGTDPRYHAALQALKVSEPLDVATIAKGIVRSVIADPGFLPPSGSLAGGIVPPFPESSIQAVTEAAQTGISSERLRVHTAITGLPPAPGELLDLLNRGVIAEGDFYRGIAEGDTRVEWGPYLIQLRHHVTSPTIAAGLRLRGWRNAQYTYDVGALSGYTPEQMDELYLDRGRPAAPGQMATAVARGIDGPDGRPMDEAQFTKGITESDIRPEWAPLLWGIRFVYPPLFQINRLVQAGAITPDVAADWAHKDRYAPEVVTALTEYWNQPAAAATDTWVKRAQTQLWTRAHREYMTYEIDDPELATLLGQIGVPAAEQAEVTFLWQVERGINRLDLTPTQIRKAYVKAVWTQDQAIQRLEDQGMTAEDALAFLESA